MKSVLWPEIGCFDTIIQIMQLCARFYWFSMFRGSEHRRKNWIFANLPISKEAKKCVVKSVMKSVLWDNVADLYHFDTDPDSGCEKICYGSGFRMWKNLLRIRIQDKLWYGSASGSRLKWYGSGSRKKRNKYQDILICDKNAQISCFVCVNYLTITFLLIIRAN